MAKYKSDFLNTLDERGFIHQCSDFAGLDALAAKGKAVGYIGFDCTAPSLHIGNMIVHHDAALAAADRQQADRADGRRHHPRRRSLGQGRDARASCPSSRSRPTRPACSGVFAKLMTFGAGRTDAVMLDNAEWLTKLNYIEMLRDVGRHFSVNRMLTLDSVKTAARARPGDELHRVQLPGAAGLRLHRAGAPHGCNLQMGASDQWGNIVTGIDLGRRMGTHQLYALTTPLLTTSSGAKMGKSVAGAVWLNEDMLAAYDFWQYWRNIEDADVGRFLKLFTTLPMAEIARLAALQGAEINEAKKVLATEVTAMLHGRDKAEAAAETAQETFEQGVTAKDLPTVKMTWSAAEDNSEHEREQRSAEAILRASGLASSLGDGSAKDCRRCRQDQRRAGGLHSQTTVQDRRRDRETGTLSRSTHVQADGCDPEARYA